MKAYYHHVGERGLVDIIGTIIKKISYNILIENLPENNSLSDFILADIFINFGDKDFNCWGVPEGANYIMQNLEPGDFVFLIPELHSPIIFLCEVVIYYHYPMPRLSQALWESPHYPYIFFCNTWALEKSWFELCKILDYKVNYNPRGLILPIDSEKITEFYIKYLIKNFAIDEKRLEHHS